MSEEKDEQAALEADKEHFVQTQEELDRQDEAAKEKEEPVDFASLLVPPHTKKSRKVTEEDIPRVMKDAHIMYNLCHTQVGYIPGCFAVHHSQIDDKDPLNFFVTMDKEVVLNPEIVRHTKFPVVKTEGCLSFSMNPPKKVERFHKIEAECNYLTRDGKISELITLSLSGKNAEVWQHETDHGNGILIYSI